MKASRLSIMVLVATVLVLATALPAFAAAGGAQATVSGTVLGSDGVAIPGATVTVSLAGRAGVPNQLTRTDVGASDEHTGGYDWVATITADSGSSWSYGGKAGDYKFDVAAPSSDPATLYLTTANKGVYTLDVTLQSYGTIAGTITDSDTGLPLPGATVELYKRNADGTWPTSPFASPAAPDGAYSSGDVPTGVYRVRASAAGYVAKYYGESAISGPVDLVVNRASALTASIALFPAASGTATVTGSVVSGAARTPYANAYVWFYKQNADGTWPAYTPGWGTPTFTFFTNSLGNYTAADLPLGNYKVRFFTIHTGTQYWQYVYTWDAATAIELTAAGQIVTGVDGWYNRPL